MHVSLMYPNRYLCAADLKGKDVTLTVAEIKHENLMTEGGDKEPNWVLYFEETRKRHEEGKSQFDKVLVLNKTNAKLIAKATGESDADKWAGQSVTLYPTTCRAFGQVVECIRVNVPGEKRTKAR